MKKAVILHGTNNTPSDNWYPWAKNELETRGYTVYTPLLPDNHAPNKATYEDFLKHSGWDFSDNIVIGHSSGATTALNLLMSDWFPKIKALVLVGTFLNENLLDGASWYVKGQFDNLFPEAGFNPELVRAKSNTSFFIHGDNDPYCSFEEARSFAKSVHGELIVVENGLHLSSNSKELPELVPILDSL